MVAPPFLNDVCTHPVMRLCIVEKAFLHVKQKETLLIFVESQTRKLNPDSTLQYT